jgi:AcrR family transcriptional regulator
MTSADIIQAAFTVWGQELYKTTSLTEVARLLGVSKTALYRHFKDKDALLASMYTSYHDEYVAFIKPDFEKAMNTESKRECLFIIIRVLTEYYARHQDRFVFALIEVYGNRDQRNMQAQFLERGLDLSPLSRFRKDKDEYPSVMQFIICTVTMWLAHFHKHVCKHSEGMQRSEGTLRGDFPSEEQVQELIALVEDTIAAGMDLVANLIEKIYYAGLDELVSRRDLGHIDEGNILKAVAGAVAEAGPWNASMEMVARRSGLSKSGLYAHFKSKQDMLRQLFLTEFAHIIDYAKEGTRLSVIPEEQLYLGIFSLVAYLRSRPEILVAMDWIKTRRLDLGRPGPEPMSLARLFSDIELEALKNPRMLKGITIGEESDFEQLVHWILFLIVNMLMHRPDGMDYADLPNSSVRLLYRVITLGLKGFQL